LGDARRAAGDHEGARAAYREAVARNRKIYADAPALAYLYRWKEGWACLGLGHVAADLGEVGEARRRYREDFALLAPGRKTNERLYHQLEIATHLGLGRLAYREDKRDEAAGGFRSARDLLARWAPGSPERAWFLANCPDRAFRDAQLARDIAEKLVRGGP